MRVALTGATGFIGRNLVRQLIRDKHCLTILLRDKQSEAAFTDTNVKCIIGSMGDGVAEARLVEGADCVIHLAGATQAVNINNFHRVNTIGAARLVTASRRAGVRRYILISSLAAREPRISDYAQTKRLAELATLKMAGDMPVTIIRPPAVFGAGDPATAPLLAALKHGFLPIPGGQAGRNTQLSVIHVDDLVRSLMEHIKTPHKNGAIIEPYGQKNVSWTDLKKAAELATGQKVRLVAVPPVIMKITGAVMDAVSGLSRRPIRYSGGKVRELLHADWVGEIPAPTCTPLDEAFAASLGLPVPGARNRAAVEGPRKV